MNRKMTVPVPLHRDWNNRAVKRRANLRSHGEVQPAPEVIAYERRRSRRFPIELAGEMCVRRLCVQGTTINLSSGGLLMRCAKGAPRIGARVTIRLTNWPGREDIALIIQGTVLRNSNGYVAVRRKRYRFAKACTPLEAENKATRVISTR